LRFQAELLPLRRLTTRTNRVAVEKLEHGIQMKIFIRQNDQTLGPFSQAELMEKIYSGEVFRTSLACAEGSQEWMPLSALLDKSRSVDSSKSAPPVAIDLALLRDPKEKTALMWLYIAAVPAALLLLLWTVVTFGGVLIFIGLFVLFRMFGEAWFMAYLKTNAVRVSPTQLPEIHRIVATACDHLKMSPPEVYVMQANVWNSYAAKIFGQRVVVLLSGAVDSILLKGDQQQLAWLVGHELGHHWAGHLEWKQKIAHLGGWLVWVALWRSRRGEFTCDRVGLYCAGSLWASRFALMNATVGAQLGGKVNMDEAVSQWQQHRGEFFVKYRTLYSTHPHLLARLENLNCAAAEFGMSK
jgi:Zn-dependent protease with chaperone function